MDLYLTHERFGSTSNPSLNGHLHYPDPADIDKPLNEADADKIRDYGADYNNRNSNSTDRPHLCASLSSWFHQS